MQRNGSVRNRQLSESSRVFFWFFLILRITDVSILCSYSDSVVKNHYFFLFCSKKTQHDKKQHSHRNALNKFSRTERRPRNPGIFLQVFLTPAEANSFITLLGNSVRKHSSLNTLIQQGNAAWIGNAEKRRTSMRSGGVYIYTHTNDHGLCLLLWKCSRNSCLIDELVKLRRRLMSNGNCRKACTFHCWY